MPTIDPQRARQFAVEVVEKLRAAGFEALWAGGCVRDLLLNRQPKDYDVATSAEPDQVRDVFGRRRSYAIGAAFGVIAVRGPRGAGQVEVATFRRDAAYSDGRHPDSVTFSTAEDDAQRRDFTINGLFYDPVAERVIDYVGGQRDLEAGVVRAIGDPAARIAEDKLRMLRAVRFTATFDFRLDEQTLAAVQRQASELVIVSAERVVDELRKMLQHSHRRRAAELLREAGLLQIIFPDADALLTDASDAQRDAWQRVLNTLDTLENPTFSIALAALLREFCQPTTVGGADAEDIGRRLRLKNVEIKTVQRLLDCEHDLRNAHQVGWPRLQRLLISADIDDLLKYGEAVCRVLDGGIDSIEHCRQKLALPSERLNPPELISGNDLRAAGVPPGAAYKSLLRAVRDEQLEGRLSDTESALEFVQRLRKQKKSTDRPEHG